MVAVAIYIYIHTVYIHIYIYISWLEQFKIFGLLFRIKHLMVNDHLVLSSVSPPCDTSGYVRYSYHFI